MALARRAFIAATILWAGLIVLAPFAATRPSPGRVWYALAFAVYGAGRFICHQLPQRSFYLWTAQLPVCARCTGIYVGGALAAMVAAGGPVWPQRARETRGDAVTRTWASKRRRKGWQRRPEPRPRTRLQIALDRLGLDSQRARVVVVVAALPTAATLLYEWTTGDRPSNIIRAISGAPLGAAIVLILAAALVVSAPQAQTLAMAGRKVN